MFPSENKNRIGFGGGCHWCTEAVFESLKGVVEVRQGWIASCPPNEALSEAVIVTFTDEIPIEILIEIHLMTHSSASRHSMRQKYRSAVYWFDEKDAEAIRRHIARLSQANGVDYITEALQFKEFKLNKETQLHYYSKNKTAPFCQTHISPKLALLRQRFGKHAKQDF
ncbi:peptide-methionine (S)-S-oxide reductase [Flavobacterium selenitireducens]|uniref:peptide-methionine (S)-S-oxide reductase n=1 Tax=Flavobacterium selenitireducens TaxID=2722704 RepID=UPI00168BFDE3|nr:peptide-methionine (S)-S-oxide reductase [Flavobacterium selenitireducens]MBD3581269.1 peptide methionine sulfoxide reductase [Flavobacterium selenitireducens]